LRKVIVFQHVANEILGTLNPLLKKESFRVRYVNFDRDPNSQPSLDRYNGLIILGGHMGVYEAEKYTHIKVEMKLIEQALKKNIPILGICLGAQILAHVLGANVMKAKEKEIGWYDIQMTEAAKTDALFGHFKKTEKIFQLHGDTFEIPQSAVHLASSEICPAQAFRFGDHAYGLQFHLEVDAAMIARWLKTQLNIEELEKSNGKFTADKITQDTEKYISHSIDLSNRTFMNFIRAFGVKARQEILGSDHGKPTK
jgi:GMP synthase (glutamine-hydrolysing)